MPFLPPFPPSMHSTRPDPSKGRGSPAYFRSMQLDPQLDKPQGLGRPGKTARTRKKNERTIQNRIARANAQKRKNK